MSERLELNGLTQTQFAEDRRTVRFIEFGPHKTIEVLEGPASGKLRVSDQRTIDTLREAFEGSGWEVVDCVG